MKLLEHLKFLKKLTKVMKNLEENSICAYCGRYYHEVMINLGPPVYIERSVGMCKECIDSAEKARKKKKKEK